MGQHPIIFRRTVVQTRWPGVKIHLVSDFDQDAKESQQCSRNPLVILIDAGDFELYKLLLNRVLLDSSDIKGVPISHCITEAVIELQRRGKKELVLETINSFDYVPAGQHFWYPLESSLFFHDLSDYDSKKLVQSDSVFRTIFADEETSYHSSKMFRFFHSLWAYKQHLLLKTKAESTYSDESIARVDFYRRHGLRMCVVPLTCLSHYPSVDLDLHQLLLSDRYSSQFSFSKSRKAAEELIDDGYSLIYALILSYKWKKFVRIRFYQAFLIHLLFYIAYFLSIAFAQEVFGFVSGSSSLTDSNAHVVLIVLFFLTGTVLLIQEVRQFWSSPRKYMASFYNFFDLLVLLLTTINFIQMVCGVDYMIEVGSVCVLVIWLHGLLRLRVIYTIGHTLEIIIQLFHKVSQIILLMIVVVAAFSHAFIMLLRHQDDSYFQEKYTGTTNSSDPSADPNVAFSDGASNDFVDVFKSFKSVWFFIYGIWDPVTSGDAADNVMAAILAIAFSFIVLLIFFNIVIGFMSASIEEMIQQGKRAWLIHYSNVIMEIEQYWCFESNKEYFRHMYYVATDKEIENQQRRLQEESEYLIQHYDKLQHDGKRSPIVKPFFANDY
ncbi:Transient receptor potential cation channel subfamily V member 4 [Choanephora cucurbitarum]|uniref:Transient receptor potential cation channel subfamily V member 4 n=1 Tax=Choanephora cucurbitarum TaxID=101091 RepID=A0A1C7N0E3_9FUNG|nr:Transient receptor potential cation channel subfamily V member 4 [Choanephora cucurbitarum]